MAKGDPVRQIAAALSKVPTNSVEPIGAQFKEIAERHGGRFTPRRYQLTGVVAQVYDKGDSVNMILAGRPAGFWAIRSYGRGAVRPIRKKALSNGQRVFANAGPARGNGAWDRAVSELDRAVPDVVTKVLDRTVT
jgi:hypothetical protein